MLAEPIGIHHQLTDSRLVHLMLLRFCACPAIDQPPQIEAPRVEHTFPHTFQIIRLAGTHLEPFCYNSTIPKLDLAVTYTMKMTPQVGQDGTCKTDLDIWCTTTPVTADCIVHLGTACNPYSVFTL